jgi:hypothetical protein
MISRVSCSIHFEKWQLPLWVDIVEKPLWRSARSGLSGKHRATRAVDAQKRPRSRAQPKTKKRDETTKRASGLPHGAAALTPVSRHFPSCEREGELSRLTGLQARFGLQKQKNGRRGQAAPQIAAYYVKPKDALRAKRPSRDIAASRAA